MATPERKKLSHVFCSISICISVSVSVSISTSIHIHLHGMVGLAYVDWLLRINQRINLTHYYLCACSQRLFRCFPPYPAAVVVVVLVADFISKIEIVLQMSRPMRYLLPCLRYICSRVGCRKINGAKMIQLREPRRQKKWKRNENQRKTGNRWQLRRQILEARPEVAWE